MDYITNDNGFKHTSAYALYNMFEQKGNLVPSIMVDLFGCLNWDKKIAENKSKFDEIISLFIGLYKGLYLMDVSFKEVYRCFTKNKLDDLIHIKYSINASNYYKEFCKKNMKIGHTFIAEDESNIEDISSETVNNNEPFIFTTIQPPYHYIQHKTNLVKSSLMLDSLDKIILQKIIEYKRQDKINNKSITSKYVNVDDVKKLLFKQEDKCYVCGDNVITQECQPRCLYQITLDRIDNNLPHNKNNVLICCLYCNCYSWKDDNDDVCLHKLCIDKCHTIKRTITRKRYNIPKEEINKLLIS